MSKKNIIIANWKMNHSFDDSIEWVQEVSQNMDYFKNDHKKGNLPEVILCPPAILIDNIDSVLMEEIFKYLEENFDDAQSVPEEEFEKFEAENRNIQLGGQDCHHEDSGAYTGDISAQTLKDCNCRYVILGHSERRQHHLESDSIIAKKVKNAVKNELTPVLCIGESSELRQKDQHLDSLEKQIKNSIPKNISIDELIIAYEPIWSIGTGTTPSSSQISEIAELITKVLNDNKSIKVKKHHILYGGSTNKDNAKDILKIKNINGLLVGGASLKAEDFSEIIKLA